MAKKLVISESQLKRIIKHIEEGNEPIGVLTEEVVVQEDIIQEGWKDIVLGVALLAGVGLTGQNQAQAQKAVNDPAILKQVQNVLQDDRLEDVVDSLEAAGMDNAMEKIQKNADKLEKNFNEKAVRLKGIKGGLRLYTSKELKQQSVNNYQKLEKKLKAGYALAGISQDTLKEIITEKFPQTPVVDSLSVTVDAGDYFGAGDYILSDEGKAILKNILDQIKDQSAVVVGIKIESSTDKQRVSTGLSDKLVDLGYEKGNEGLSSVRNDQLKKELINLGVDTSLIKQNVKWDQGKGELGSPNPQDPSARYVKITIDAIHITEDAPEDVEIETEVDVIVYNFDLVKINKKSIDLKLVINWPNKRGKTKQKKCSTKCATFR
jgi:hypothetical protein